LASHVGRTKYRRNIAMYAQVAPRGTSLSMIATIPRADRLNQPASIAPKHPAEEAEGQRDEKYLPPISAPRPPFFRQDDRIVESAEKHGGSLKIDRHAACPYNYSQPSLVYQHR
jgi:hypothetical protein